MTEIVLSAREQDCVRRLMSLEPTPGSLPPEPVLDIIDRLIPSDAVVICLALATGCVVEHVDLPASATADMDPQVCTGPLMLGLVHQSRHPMEREASAALRDHRRGHPRVPVRARPCRPAVDGPRHADVSDEDLAMLRMISPALQRLMRRHLRRAPARPPSP